VESAKLAVDVQPLAVGGHPHLIRPLAAALLALILMVPPYWKSESLVHELLDAGGYLLLVACVGGRILSLVHISGRKSHRLARCGPYSVVRNPLYLSNLFGAVGVGLSHASLVVGVLLGGLLMIYYTTVVAREERYLLSVHGEAFGAYRAEVPRWLPRLRGWRHSAELTLHPRLLARGIAESLIFLAVPLLLELLEAAHNAGLMQVSVRLP